MFAEIVLALLLAWILWALYDKSVSKNQPPGKPSFTPN